MKISILIDKTHYPYHQNIATNICNFFNNCQHTANILDVHSEIYDHLCLKKLDELSPEVLITLDLAGFHFRTQTGETALNMLTTKNLNLIWGNQSKYTLPLSKKLSLSMIFYDATGNNFSLPQHYPNMQYYKTNNNFYIDITPQTKPDAKIAFAYIWKDFTQEVLLSET